MVLSGHHAYLLLGTGYIKEYNSVRLVGSGLYVTFVLTAALCGSTNVRVYAMAYVGAQALALAFSWQCIVRRLRPRFHLDLELVPRVLIYGLKTLMAGVAVIVNLRLDQLVMSIVLTPTQLGLYVVAVAASGVFGPLFSGLAQVVLPRTLQADGKIAAVFVTARYIPLLVLAIIVMPWGLPAIFGGSFQVAVRSAQVLVVAGLFQGLNAVLGNSLRGLGHAGLPAVAESAGLVATILLLCTLMPRFGILGAAIASLVAYGCVVILQSTFLVRVGGVRLTELVRPPTDGVSAKEYFRLLRQRIGV
jgi:O-antigen/teichoic acid export membrane protein